MIALAEQRIKEKKNVKLVIGAEIVITKPVEDDSVEPIIYAHTSPESAYSERGVAAIVRGKKGELEKRITERINQVAGSGWSIQKIKGLFVTTYTQTPSRGSSYIPVPPELQNSKLGLINIKNEDE